MDWSMRTALLILWIALVLSAIGNSNGEERIVCYYTNWSVYRPGTAKYSPQNINPYLCTHLIYAFGGFTKDNTLKPFDKYQDIEKGGYAKFTGLKTYNKNLKTMLAIGGWNEGSSRFSTMVADPSRRRELVKNAVKFLRQNHFDGLDLDWEYPAFRDGGKPRDRNNYADLVQELREEFERESSKTGRPRLLLSMAIPAGIEYLEKGYDLPRLNEYLDFFNLLSYDYHSAFEPAVNHHSPLYGLEEDNEYNYDNELTIDYTVKYLLNHDVTPEKLVLGIPTYGRSYTLYNADANEIGAPADGPGEEGDATREKGYLAYYEICENIAKSDEWQVVQPNEKAMGPYAFRDNQWVGYDDENIVRVKALYVKEKKLGGIMFWAIDNDDFRGKCHGRPYPLIEAAKEALLTGSDKSSSEKTKAVANRKKTKPISSQRTTDSSNDRKYSATQQRPKSSSNRKRPSSSRSSNRQSTRNFRDEEENEEVERNTATNRKRPGNRAGGRRKPQHTRKVQKTEKNSVDDEKSLSNSLTTPEPPTTPDPGSDFKCEEDGFFPHPRDCKKYFWCLDAGPGGLGIVAHQFTCPSGLVFNKVSDSCDYPRNVICPKVKTASATTAAPTTSTTVRTTTKRRTTTLAPESEEEEYEYEDDIEEEEELPVSTTAKPLLYKTISRSRPTTTTTTTEAATTTRATATTESARNLKDVASESDIDDTEDPRVLKELIDLIKKAGGIEQLEKQLHLQEKNSDNGAGANKEKNQATPASISRSLYEKVLNRQANRLFGTSTARSTTSRATNSRNTFQNGPGRAQFEGLDEVPEVKGLRRNKKPQYVTIERQRSSTPTEEDDVDEDAEADLTDTVSSDNESISTIQEKETQPPLRRVTPSYVNIRRARPTTPATEDDVEEKEEVENSQIAQHSTSTDAPEENSQESTSQKSRYTNVQRFRSTTLKSSESGETLQSSEYSVENLTSPTFSQETTSTLEPQSFTTLPSSESTTKDSKSKLLDDDVPTISTTHLPATEAVKSVENSITELLLTTFPAPSSPRTTPSPILRPTASAVSPPRPFGFPRRTRPTSTTTTTTPVSTTSEQTRAKVNLEIPGLPTLKQLLNGNNNTATSPIVVEPTSSYKISNSLYDEFENDQLLPEIIDSDGLKLPVKILDDGSGEVNITYPFAVLNLPRGVINANITSTVLKIEVINSEELKNESHEKAVNSALPEKEEIQKKEVTNVRNFRRRYRDRQETRGTTRRPSNRRRNERRRGNTRATTPNDSTPESSLKFSSTTLMTTVDDFLRTSVKPTTLRGSSIPFPKSQGPPRGFFITKSLDDVPETTEKLELNRATTEMPTTTTSFGEVTTGENEYANTESISNETTQIVDSASNEVDSSTLRGDRTEVIDNFLPTTLRPVETTLNENETEYIDTTSTTIEPELTTSTETWMEITSTVDAFQPTTDLTALPVINSLFETTTYDNVDEKLRESNFAMGESSEKYWTTESSDVTVATTPVNLSTLRNEIFDEPNDTTQSISYATTEKIKNEDITKMTTEEIPITTDAPQLVSITSEYNKTPVSMNLSQSVEHTSTKIPSQSSNWQNSVSTSVNLPSATTDTSTISSTTPITPQQPIEQRKRSDIKRSRGKIRYGSQTTTSVSIERKSRPLSAYRRRTTTTTHSSHNETDNAPITPDPIISSSMRPTRRIFNRGRGKARGRELAISTTEKSSSATEILEDTTENGEDSGVNELTPESSQSQPIDDQSLAESSHSDILGEVGGLRHSGIFVRRPGTFHRPSTTRSSATVGASTQGRYSSKFTTPKTENYDQNGRAQEIAVSLIDPSVIAAFETGKDTSTYRGGQEEFRGLTETPIPKTTTQSRRRQRPRGETKTEQRVTTSRPRRPAIIDYDYYVDEEVRIAVKPELKDKIYVTSSGRIGCLDQGTFAHPFSCKKFITCARVVGGQVVPTEYSCPNKLSFDPVGGICNWSAGLGCKETLQ